MIGSLALTLVIIAVMAIAAFMFLKLVFRFIGWIIKGVVFIVTYPFRWIWFKMLDVIT